MTLPALQVNKERSDLANRKETIKQAKYASLSPNYDFRPIAIDSLGAYGSSAFNTIKEFGNRIKEYQGIENPTLQLRERLSIAIQKGNCLVTNFAILNE